MSLMMKYIIQAVANRCGYTISRRRRRPSINHIDVLDLVVRSYMEGHSELFVVQIGANDGQRADPVHQYIEKYGWRGVLVEPQPRAFEQLKATYAQHPQVVLENCAIAREDGETRFYTVADSVPFRWTGLAQLNRGRLERALAAQGFRDSAGMIQCITVPALSLRSLIARHSISRIGLLQIDTEGFDYEIIKMIDFQSMAPAIIHFEHACVPLDERAECWECLAGHGYKLAFVLGDTIAYRQPGDSDERAPGSENGVQA